MLKMLLDKERKSKKPYRITNNKIRGSYTWWRFWKFQNYGVKKRDNFCELQK